MSRDCDHDWTTAPVRTETDSGQVVEFEETMTFCARCHAIGPDRPTTLTVRSITAEEPA